MDLGMVVEYGEQGNSSASCGERRAGGEPSAKGGRVRRRFRWSAVAAVLGVAAAALVAACGGASGPGGLFVVGLDTTRSTTEQRDRLIRIVADDVAPAAAEHRAVVRVVSLSGRSATRPTRLAQVDFSAAPSDNPLEVSDYVAAQRGRLRSQLEKSLPGVEPDTRTDPYGVLRVAADLFADTSPDTERVAVLVGDAVPTLSTCNANVLFGAGEPTAALDELAAACMQGPFPRLDGAKVWVFAGGIDDSDELPVPVALGSRQLMEHIVDASGGHLTRWVADPVAPGGP